MTLFFCLVIIFMLMFGWSEVENTHGNFFKNFGRGMLTGLYFGVIVGVVISVILWILGVYK